MIDIALKESPDGQWLAQGLNIDYAAAGASIDEARLNFWHGLAQTFYENQRRFGNVEKVMRIPPPEALEEFARNKS